MISDDITEGLSKDSDIRKLISQPAVDTDINHRGSIARIAISLGDISSCVATTEKWAGATKGNSGTNFGRENSLGSWKAKICPKVRLYFSLGSGKLNEYPYSLPCLYTRIHCLIIHPCSAQPLRRPVSAAQYLRAQMYIRGKLREALSGRLFAIGRVARISRG